MSVPEPQIGMMHCYECVYKHLRDVEHHLEDTVRVTDGKEREVAEKMIDIVRALRKIVFDLYTHTSVDTRNLDEVLDEALLTLSSLGKLRESSIKAVEGIGECKKIYESAAEPFSENPGLPQECEWKTEIVRPKEEFDSRSFRVICPECPNQRCSQCPPELKCATRIIIGCPKGEWDEKTKTCRVSTQVHSIDHGSPKPIPKIKIKAR
jgi:hypothetical protein